MPSVKDVTPSWYIPHLAVSGCDIAVGTHWECNSQMQHPCPSPPPSSPWCLRRSVMNMSDLMTHVTIALTPTCSNALPLSVNGLGVETADTVCRCRDRFVLFKLDLFCVVVCVFIVKICLSQTLVTLYYTHAQLHMRTLHVFTQLCIFFLHRRPSFCVLWSFSFLIEVCRQHMDCEIFCRPVVSVFCFCKCPFIAGNWAWECCHSKVIVVWGSRCAKPILCSPLLFTIKGLLWFCVMRRAPWLIIVV